jgi:hypothetical protein
MVYKGILFPSSQVTGIGTGYGSPPSHTHTHTHTRTFLDVRDNGDPLQGGRGIPPLPHTSSRRGTIENISYSSCDTNIYRK